MSRIKLLLDVIEDIRSLADSLQAVATALGQNDSDPQIHISLWLLFTQNKRSTW